MVEFVTQVVDRLGYAGVALLMLIETLIPPIPSEIIMPVVGVAAANGRLTLAGVTLAAVVGATAGATAWYAAARAVGPDRLLDLADRHGRWLGLSRETVRRPTDWFARRGGWTIFLARILPGMRVSISVPAGLSAMPLPAFLAFTFAGYAVWYGALAMAGYALGTNVALLFDLVTAFAPWVWSALAIALIWRVSIVRRAARPS